MPAILVFRISSQTGRLTNVGDDGCNWHALFRSNQDVEQRFQVGGQVEERASVRRVDKRI